MSKLKSTQKVWCLVLTVLMAVSIAACGSSNGNGADTNSSTEATTETTQAETTQAPATPVTLSIWNVEANPGIQNDPVAEEIKKLTGVTLNVVLGDAQKFKVLMAGNDLPDIIYSNETSQGVTANELIKSGQVIALDSLIDQYGTNLKKNAAFRLQYSKKYMSAEQDKTFYIPILEFKADPNKPDVSFTGYLGGYSLRWDVYAKIGYPEMKTTDDLLNVLKKMQDANPKTADGKKVYAISGWNDWGIWPWYVPSLFENGCGEGYGGVYFDYKTDTAKGKYYEDRFWDSIKFFNKAYMMGLVDPEAFTQKNENFVSKAASGQVLMAYFSWQQTDFNNRLAASGHPEMGFEKPVSMGLPIRDGITNPSQPVGYGANYQNAITTNCKTPERAIQFLDFMQSTDAARLVWSGVKGKQWDIVDGKPAPTKEFLDLKSSDTEYKKKTGISIFNKYCGYTYNQVLPDGYSADVSLTEEFKAKDAKPIDIEFCKHYGDNYQYPGQVALDWLKQGLVEDWTNITMASSLCKAPSDESTKVFAKADEYMKVAIVKIIMAKSDAEYEAQKKKAMDDINAMGYAKAEAEVVGLYVKAKQESDALAK